MSDAPIRILLVDDHEMVRQGLQVFLASQPDFAVVGEAATGEEAIRLANTLNPDVILMDIIMPEMDGLSAIRVIKSNLSEVEIIALTSFIDNQKVLTAIQNGAAGYMMKDASPNELARAIRAAARGEVYLHPEAARRLATGLRVQATEDPSPEVLTPRELDVLQLVARGLSNQDIASDLSISLQTVKAHMSSILDKLNLNSRVQAALYALRHNVIPLDEI